METCLFLHASLNVKNILGTDPLLLEEITSGRTALEYLIQNIIKSKRISTYYLVTSDLPCDDPVEEIGKKFQKHGFFEIIRIPEDSPYSFAEHNRTIDRSFLYRSSPFGFYNAPYLLEFCKRHAFDFSVVLFAEYFVLLHADLLDAMIEQSLSKGNVFQFSAPSIPLVAAPVKEISDLQIQANLERKKKFKHIMRTIEDDAEFLSQEYHLTTNKELKKQNVEKTMSHAHQLQTILGLRNSREGIVGKNISLLFPGKEMQFYPLLNQLHLQTLRHCLSTYEELTLENFLEKENEFSASSHQNIPGYLEIEITSRCNLSCRNCPQTVLKREKGDMDESVFQKIIDECAEHIPMISLSGFGEPLLHDKIIAFVRYAKEKGVTRLALETNGLLLNDTMIRELIDTGLDILILNLDALDIYSDNSDSDALIERFLKIRSQQEKPYLVLQTINNMNRQRKIDYYFRKWQYIADCVLLLPFNDFLGHFQEEGIIDFTPPRESNEFCRKTHYSGLILSNGQMTLCKQRFEGTAAENSNSWMETWQSYKLKGLKEDFCKSCNLWYQRDILPPSDPFSYQSSFMEEKIYDILIHSTIDKGQKYYDQEEYERTLDEWEKVLRFDPSNTFIHKKLDELLARLEDT